MSGPPETDISAIAARNQPKAQFCVAAVSVILFLGLLIGACVSFQSTWSQTCDYDVKVWVVVHLSSLLLGQLLGFVPPSRKKLGLFRGFLFLFIFCWWLYGIKPCLVDNGCVGVENASMVGTNWGVGIWWFQFACLIVPCFILIIIACCFVAGPLNPNSNSSTSEPRSASPGLFALLGSTDWANVKDDVKTASSESDNAQVEPPKPSNSFANAAMSGFSAFTGVEKKDLNKLGKNFKTPTDQSTSSRQRTDRDLLTCALCFTDFLDDDKVTTMPCNTRHVFHTKCIRTWLTKSARCPICKRDVEGSLKKRNANAGAGA